MIFKQKWLCIKKMNLKYPSYRPIIIEKYINMEDNEKMRCFRGAEGAAKNFAPIKH